MADDRREAPAPAPAPEAVPAEVEKQHGLEEPVREDGAAAPVDDAPAPESKKATPPPPKKPSALATWWQSLGLDVPTVLMMLKAPLPPTIIMAMYQAKSVEKVLGSLGYLSAVISIIGLCIMPRGRFLQNLIINVFCICLAVAAALLTMYSGVKARQHTPLKLPPGTKPPTAAAGSSLSAVPFNGAASTVAAVFLFFWTYVINLARSKLPQLQFGAIIFSIIVIVACSNACLLPTVPIAQNVGRSLLIAELFAMSITTGVSLFIIPVSVRTIVQKIFVGYLMTIRGCLKTHKAFLESFQSREVVGELLTADGPDTPEAKAVTASVHKLVAVHGQLQSNLPIAKQEIGLGKFGPEELKEMNKLLRAIVLPISGLGSMVEILKQIARSKNWTRESISKLSDEDKEERERSIRDWNMNMALVHEPIETVIEAMDEGIQHVLLTLQLIPAPKPAKTAAEAKDVEGEADHSAPGQPGFAEYLEKKVNAFYQNKHLTLIEWGKVRGINFTPDFFEHPYDVTLPVTEELGNEGQVRRTQNQRQLYLLLYLEFLLNAIGLAIVAMVRYADQLKASGLLSRARLIFPSGKGIRKFFHGLVRKDDLAANDRALAEVNASTTYKVFMGESWRAKKDPEHRPAETAFERAGNGLRAISNLLKSPESAFALRVALATISLSIPLFVRQTQKWATENRVFWAVIMTAISMSPTSGQSLWGFLVRTAGTVVAMLVAWCIWYIPGNGKTAGVIVLYWAFTAPFYWFPLKMPQYAVAGVITAVTATLIVAYQLEERKIGVAAVESSGQTYLDILKFAPVRLATVVAGLACAFVWTVFPYPITEHSVMRNSMSGGLYVLANYYNIVHETVSVRMRKIEGDVNDKNSPGYMLAKIRVKLFNKLVLIMQTMRTFSEYQRWEIPIGGKFPKEQYDTIMECISHISSYMSLISFASTAYSETDPAGSSQWNADFRRLIGTVQPTSHEITMILSLCSHAIQSGQPLPPYLPKPAPFQLSDRLNELDKDILSVRHVNEPGYAAFAVMQLSARCIGADVDKLVAAVKQLVGELDFSLSVVPLESDESLPMKDGEKSKDD